MLFSRITVLTVLSYNFYFMCTNVLSACMKVHMCHEVVAETRRECWVSLELELWTFVSHQWVPLPAMPTLALYWCFLHNPKCMPLADTPLLSFHYHGNQHAGLLFYYYGYSRHLIEIESCSMSDLFQLIKCFPVSLMLSQTVPLFICIWCKENTQSHSLDCKYLVSPHHTLLFLLWNAWHRVEKQLTLYQLSFLWSLFLTPMLYILITIVHDFGG